MMVEDPFKDIRHEYFYDEVFGTHVFFACGPEKRCVKWFVAHEHLKEVRKVKDDREALKSLSKDQTKEYVGGYCWSRITKRGGHVIFIWIKDGPAISDLLAMIVHEALHATAAVIERISGAPCQNTESDETWCYFQQFLCEKIFSVFL